MFMIRMISQFDDEKNSRLMYVLLDNSNRFVQAWESVNYTHSIPERFFSLMKKSLPLKVMPNQYTSIAREYLNRDYLNVNPDYTSKEKLYTLISGGDPGSYEVIYAVADRDGFIKGIYHDCKDIPERYTYLYDEIITMCIEPNFYKWLENDYIEYIQGGEMSCLK